MDTRKATWYNTVARRIEVVCVTRVQCGGLWGEAVPVSYWGGQLLYWLGKVLVSCPMFPRRFDRNKQSFNPCLPSLFFLSFLCALAQGAASKKALPKRRRRVTVEALETVSNPSLEKWKASLSWKGSSTRGRYSLIVVIIAINQSRPPFYLSLASLPSLLPFFSSSQPSLLLLPHRHHPLLLRSSHLPFSLFLSPFSLSLHYSHLSP